LKQILEEFKRIRIFLFFGVANFGWGQQVRENGPIMEEIVNRRIIAFDGNDDRDGWIATMLDQACLDGRPNIKRSLFECAKRWSCVSVAIWDVYIVTDRSDDDFIT
jgi:hypothetical protein